MFLSSNYVLLALCATLFTWFVTMLGAAIVFFVKKANEGFMSFMFGFGAGVMIAASFFSLILPAIELSDTLGMTSWAVAITGFLIGSAFILLIDLFLPHMHLKKDNTEGIKNTLSRKILLVLSITLHNIPEGLAVGVAFGAAFLEIDGATFASAWILALGIGIQNFPEGVAVSLPLRQDGMKRSKAFLYGQASGLVEPISGVLGAVLIYFVRGLLPYLLCFASGAMIYVVAEELIPSGKTTKENKLGTIGVMVGFAVMMGLDLALS